MFKAIAFLAAIATPEPAPAPVAYIPPVIIEVVKDAYFTVHKTTEGFAPDMVHGAPAGSRVNLLVFDFSKEQWTRLRRFVRMERRFAALILQAHYQ